MKYAVLALLILCGLEGTGLFYYKDKADTIVARYNTAAAAAVTHAQAITAKDMQILQKQGATAVAAATTHTQAVQVYYKTIYVPKITYLEKQPDADEATKCSGLPVPGSILDSLQPGGR